MMTDTTYKNGMVCFDQLVFMDYQVEVIEKIVESSPNSDLDFEILEAPTTGYKNISHTST